MEQSTSSLAHGGFCPV